MSISCRYVLLFALLIVGTIEVSADYKIGAGDQLDISVIGIPSLQRRISVESDGTISFPLLGTMNVSGRTLPDVRKNIKAGLALKVYRRTAVDGGARTVIIGIDDITVSVAAYRPIYVKGGVARAGEYTYRPLMTVREALALAGGFDILPVKVGNPYFETANFRGEYEALWLEFTKQQARRWRLQTLLKNPKTDEEAVFKNIPIDAPISRSMIEKIVVLAKEQLRTQQDDYNRQEAFLAKSIDQIQTQIKTISLQKQRQDEGAADDLREFKRIDALFKKGTLVRTRVVEARRNVLLSDTRRLGTAAELSKMEQLKTNLGRQLDRLDDEKKIATLKDLEDATVRLGELRTKLQSVGEKLGYLAISKAQLTDGDRKKPNITIYRQHATGTQKIVADEGFELQPGDLIEITSNL